MAKYRPNPDIVIEATQWNRNGDHPQDATVSITAPNGFDYPSEGKVVRFFRRPDKPGETPCSHCSRKLSDHGWIDTLEGGHIVCPGDFIVTGTSG